MTVIGTILSLFILAIYYVIYKLQLSSIEQYKVEKNKEWPWKTNLTNYLAWRKLVINGLFRTVFNSIVVNFMCLTFYAWCYGWEYPWSFDPKTIPDGLTMTLQILFFIICEDFCFHFSHRALHWKPLYRLFHKQHHEFTFSAAIAS